MDDTSILVPIIFAAVIILVVLEVMSSNARKARSRDEEQAQGAGEEQEPPTAPSQIPGLQEQVGARREAPQPHMSAVKRRARKAKAAQLVLSHWYQLIENLQASPLEFYAAVEQALERREVPEARLFRVIWREGGVLSAKREYLRVRRKKVILDICAAPFGTGFFVSWWLGEFQSRLRLLISSIPWLGLAFNRLFPAVTYYKIDTALMFQTVVHSAVLEVVDEMTSAKGLRALSELERKPILREFFRR